MNQIEKRIRDSESREANISKQIVDFFIAHPYISPSRVEKDNGIAGGTLSKCINKGATISKKNQWLLIKKLAPYVLKIDGFSIDFDECYVAVMTKIASPEHDIIDTKEIINEGGSTHFIYYKPEYRQIASDYFDLL